MSKWKEGNLRTDYYHDESGKILGSVSKTNYSDDVWTAISGKQTLGDYISRETAKKAVENDNPIDLTDNISFKFDYDPEPDYTISNPSPYYKARDADWPIDFYSNLSYTIELSEEKPKKKKKK